MVLLLGHQQEASPVDAVDEVDSGVVVVGSVVFLVPQLATSVAVQTIMLAIARPRP
jgi:hypothetical protein